MKGLKETESFFYGWWVVAGAFVSIFIGLGIAIYTFTIFFKPLIQEFSWSRTAISGGQSVFAIAAGLVYPFVGRLIDRIGAKRVMIPAGAIMGLSLVGLSLMNSLWHLYFFYILMGVGVAGLTTLPGAVLVSKWFVKMRGRVMGITQAGIGIGGFAMVPLANYLIYSFGWRISYLLLGLMVWIVAIPITAFVIKDKPEDMGLLPDGEKVEEKKEATVPSEVVPYSKPEGLTTIETLRTFRFWMLGIAHFLYAIGIAAVVVHVVPFLTDIGISPKNAAVAVSFAVGLSALGMVGSSYLAEKLDTRYVLISSYLLTAIGIFILLGVKSIGMLVAFVIVFGFAYQAGLALMPLLAGRCFGLRSFGEIFGYLMLLFVAGNAVGPLLAGYLFDTTQSYNWAFITIIGGFIFASMAISCVRIHELEPGYAT